LSNSARIAFLLHAPGLRLFCGRLSARALRENAIAVAATLTAMIAVALATHSGYAVFACWLAGHFAWSTRLAWLARRGAALRAS
jgi:hypothetical protein